MQGEDTNLGLRIVRHDLPGGDVACGIDGEMLRARQPAKTELLAFRGLLLPRPAINHLGRLIFPAELAAGIGISPAFTPRVAASSLRFPAEFATPGKGRAFGHLEISAQALALRRARNFAPTRSTQRPARPAKCLPDSLARYLVSAPLSRLKAVIISSH